MEQACPTQYVWIGDDTYYMNQYQPVTGTTKGPALPASTSASISSDTGS